MRYTILLWNQEAMEWSIVFYCHSFEEYLRAAARWPRGDCVKHMVDMGYWESHNILLELEGFKKQHGLI